MEKWEYGIEGYHKTFSHISNTSFNQSTLWLIELTKKKIANNQTNSNTIVAAMICEDICMQKIILL